MGQGGAWLLCKCDAEAQGGRTCACRRAAGGRSKPGAFSMSGGGTGGGRPGRVCGGYEQGHLPCEVACLPWPVRVERAQVHFLHAHRAGVLLAHLRHRHMGQAEQGLTGHFFLAPHTLSIMPLMQSSGDSLQSSGDCLRPRHAMRCVLLRVLLPMIVAPQHHFTHRHAHRRWPLQQHIPHRPPHPPPPP